MEIHLKEISMQVSDTLYIKMEGCVYETAYMVKVMENLGHAIDSAVVPMLKSVSETGTLSRITVVTVQGGVYSSSEAPGNASQYRYLQDVLQGKSGISDVISSNVTGEAILCIYQPVYQNGQVIAGVFGTIVVEDLQDTVAFSGFDGEGYSYLIQSSGETIMRTAHEGQGQSPANFLEFLDAAEETTLSGDALQESMQQNLEGILAYKTAGVASRAYFCPVGFKNWYVISIVPEVVLDRFSRTLYNDALLLAARLLLLAMGIFALILLCASSNRKRLAEAHRQALNSNKKYEIAMRHTACQMFEYDPVSKTVQHMTPSLKTNFDFQTLISGSQSLLHKAWQTAVKEGQSQCQLRQEDGRWIRLTLSAVGTNPDAPVIGTLEDITRIKETEKRFTQEEQYCRSMLESALAGFAVDLQSGDILTYFRRGQEIPPPHDFHKMDESFLSYLSQFVHPDYERKLLQLYERRNLLGIHSRGVREISEPFMLRLSDKPQNLIWTLSTVHFLSNPATGHPIIFSYIQNVNEELRKKLELERSSQRDGLTGLYNRITFIKKMDAALKNQKPQEHSALLMMDLDGFKSINDEHGHQAGDQFLRAVAKVLTACVGRRQYTGRLGGDEFVAFLRGFASKKDIEDTAEHICREVEHMSLEEYGTSLFTLSIGVAFSRENSTFDTLYAEADRLLYQAKGRGKNRICIEGSEENHS